MYRYQKGRDSLVFDHILAAESEWNLVRIQQKKNTMNKLKTGVIGFVVVCFLIVCIMITLIWTYSAPYNEKIDIAVNQYNKMLQTQTSDIVISFTTMPNRLTSPEFKSNVLSMLSQSLRPQEIILFIPYRLKKRNTEYIIPDWLLSTPLTILRGEDQGPASKYIATLQHFQSKPNQRILIVDDDVGMHHTYVEQIHKYTNKYPDAVICSKGCLLNRDVSPNISYKSYRKHTRFSGSSYHFTTLTQKIVEEPQKVDIVLGYAGYCLTPAMVDVSFLTDFEHMPPEAFFVDDLVMSANLAKNNISCLVCPGIPHPTYNFWQNLSAMFQIGRSDDIESLAFNDNKEKTNDAIVMDYFAHCFQK